MVWRYLAIDALACEISGLASGRREDVAGRLRREGLLIVEMEIDVMASCRRMLRRRSIPAGELSAFFKDLANMLQAGVTLSCVLGTFQRSFLSSGISASCALMQEGLAAGKSLAQAMDETDAFPVLAINAVRSGERSGQLICACQLLAEYYQLTGVLKGKILHALAYPLGIVIFLGVAMVYVAQEVVPQLVSFLPDEAMSGGLTRGMIDASCFIRMHGALLLAGAGGVAMVLAMLMIRYRRAVDFLLRRVPFFGALRKDMDIGLCFFDIFILLKSGIALDVALREASAASVTPARQQLGVCVSFLVSGHTFAQALSATGYFPPLLVETIRIGEEIGAYGDYCERVFRFYYRSFETRLGILAATIQPVFLAVCALWLVAFALAFLKPIYANLTHIGVLKL